MRQLDTRVLDVGIIYTTKLSIVFISLIFTLFLRNNT